MTTTNQGRHHTDGPYSWVYLHATRQILAHHMAHNADNMLSKIIRKLMRTVVGCVTTVLEYYRGL